MKESEILFTLNFDIGYLEWGRCLISSLAVNAPDSKIVIYTINVPRNIRKELIGLHKNVIVHNQWIPFLSEKFKRHYMINRKAKIFLKTINKYTAKYYVLLDADMILINPIKQLIIDLEGHNAGIVYRAYEKGYHMKVNASLIVIDKKKKGEKLIQLWKNISRSKFILKTISAKLSIIDIILNRKKPFTPPIRIRRGSWFWDQLTLYYAIQQINLKYKNYPIDIYLNSVFNDHAVFWSAHSGNKKLALKKFTEKVHTLKKSPDSNQEIC